MSYLLPGVLLLNPTDIKKSDKAVVGSALNKGFFELKQAPSVVVPATAAVWAVHSADVVNKGKSAGSCGSVQDVVQGAVHDMGPDLFSAFDLVLSQLHSGGSDVSDGCTDRILHRAAGHEMPPQAAALSSGSRAAAGSHGGIREQSRRQLRVRVAQGNGMPMPCISPAAMVMIQRYYALLRQQSPGYGQGEGAMEAGPHTLASLLRMATACARLHMRNDVTTMPDAILAIYLLQESMRAKVHVLSYRLLCSCDTNLHVSRL